jgi:hypothetical protein
MVLDKISYGIHICSASLDNVAGLTADMPVEFKFLYMAVYSIPQFPCHGFSKFRAGITADHITNPGKKSCNKGKERTNPDISLECF